MNEQLSNKLIERYPMVLPDGMYVECGSGWFWILDSLCESIQNAYRHEVRQRRFEINDGKIAPDEELDDILCPYAVQIKEKFGGLRFYVDGMMGGWSKDTASFINMAESLSFRTCSKCGCPAHECYSGSWVRTNCTKCDMLIMENDYEALKEREQEFVEETLLTLGDREKNEAF